jgi:hypothetical protein
MEVSGQLHAPAALPTVSMGYEVGSLEAAEKRKIEHCLELNLGCSACSPTDLPQLREQVLTAIFYRSKFFMLS